LYQLFAIGVVDTGGKFTSYVVDFAASILSTTPVIPVAKFSAGVVDTCGKFATRVIDTGGAP
jgi:hypothetical protein